MRPTAASQHATAAEPAGAGRLWRRPSQPLAKLEMAKADQIWNRACNDWRLRNSAAGDRALAGMLLAHGLIMNGGVLDAVENMNDAQLAAAVSGYKVFGLGPVADLLSRTKKLFDKKRAAPEELKRINAGDVVITILFEDNQLGDLERQLDAEYAKYVPDDSALFGRFERHLAASPNDFADVHEQVTENMNP